VGAPLDTIDTSRVALALARARIMGARYPYYLLADSKDGQHKEAEVTQSIPSETPTHGNIRQGFVYERVPHVTLKAIANDTEVDVIWEEFQGALEPLRAALNSELTQKWEEWEIPREADGRWPEKARKLHAEWWQQRIARQTGVDASIAAKADFEYLYDSLRRQAQGPRGRSVHRREPLPHRVLAVDENDELIDGAAKSTNGDEQGFVQMILENLKTAGVQQAHKEDKIAFTAMTPWPATWLARKAGMSKARQAQARRSAPLSSLVLSSVQSPDRIWLLLPARPATPVSMC